MCSLIGTEYGRRLQIKPVFALVLISVAAINRL
jgi:hypothetical protein